MDEIICPMCGKANPADLLNCQYCEARLQPMTDDLSRSQPPIHPGDEPTHKVTAELEPVLPQWLRRVRQQARESAEEEAEEVAEEEAAAEAAPLEAEDLLAGLQSQPEEAEEVPDWLANLRGERTASTTEESPSASAEASLPEESSVEPLPGWVSDLSSTPARTGEKKEDLSNWPADNTQQEATSEEPEPDRLNVDLPDWLKTPDEEDQNAGDDKSKKEAIESPTLHEEEEQPREKSMTDWLASFGSEPASQSKGSTPAFSTEETSPANKGIMPDWLSSLNEETTAQPESPESMAFVEGSSQSAPDDLPGWLDQLDEPAAQPDRPALIGFSEEPSQDGIEDRPSWLSKLEGTAQETDNSSSTAFTEEPPRVAQEGTPDWLASLSEQEETQAPPTSEAPVWASLFDEPVDTGQPVEETPEGVPTPESKEPAQQEKSNAPAFINDEGAPMSSGDVDAMCSLEMPDWLSDISSASQGESATTPGAGTKDDLSPAELPSWVQAMRPVEAVLSGSGDETTDQIIEERGPLAGLRGVLPSALGAGPTSKPKAYSLKLQTSEDQRTNATLLEQLLAGETSPSPMTTQPVAFSQRLLRQIIALVVVIAVAAPVFLGTQINPVPYSVPLETNTAKQIIETNLPADAPVLVIFDYEPALAGELEATAAPLIDYMVLLKHPRLALIASTPIGSGLSERFMKLENTQVATHYQPGQQYVNLGFLPGGAAGVFAFADNPAATKPVSIDGQNAWETPALQNVQQLSEFAALILLTDDAETARTWIEQTQGKLGQAYMLVAASAQVGPMLQPYVQSGQIDGLVTGIGNSAPIEQFNSGRPGLGRLYWDGYGLGLLTVVVIISLGSLWNLVSNWRSLKARRGI